MQNTDTRLTMNAQLGWAIGALGISAYVGITMIYLLFFLTEALHISPAWAGIALLIPRIWDGITDPAMGAISDRTKTRMGRRRPFILVGGPLFGLAFAAIFLAPAGASEMMKVVYVTIAFLITSTAYTIYYVPYSAMIPEMTANYKERTLLAGYKMVASRVGIVLAVTVAPWLFNSRETLAEGFMLMGLIFGAFMAITALVSFFSTARAPQIVKPVKTFSLRDEILAIRQNRPFRILWSVFLLQNIAIGATATTGIYFVTYVMKVSPALVGIIMALAPVTATFATPVWIWIARRMGKRETYFMGMGITATMTLPILFIPEGYVALLVTVLLLAGIGDAANQLASNSMVPDTVEVDELQSGERREGIIYGAWTFCLKLGMALGAFLVSLSLSFFGFSGGSGAEGVQSQEALTGIRMTYSLVPFTLWILAILLLRKYDLNEKKFDEIKQAIQKAEAQQ